MSKSIWGFLRTPTPPSFRFIRLMARTVSVAFLHEEEPKLERNPAQRSHPGWLLASLPERKHQKQKARLGNNRKNRMILVASIPRHFWAAATCGCETLPFNWLGFGSEDTRYIGFRNSQSCESCLLWFEFWLSIRLSWMKARLPLCKTRQGSTHWEVQQWKSSGNDCGKKYDRLKQVENRLKKRQHDFLILSFFVPSWMPPSSCLYFFRFLVLGMKYSRWRSLTSTFGSVKRTKLLDGSFSTKFHSAYITFKYVHQCSS